MLFFPPINKKCAAEAAHFVKMLSSDCCYTTRFPIDKAYEKRACTFTEGKSVYLPHWVIKLCSRIIIAQYSKFVNSPPTVFTVGDFLFVAVFCSFGDDIIFSAGEKDPRVI